MASEKQTPTVTTQDASNVALQEENPHLKTITANKADETLKIVEEYGGEIGAPTPQESKKLRRKLYFRLVLLLIVIDLMLFVCCRSSYYAASDELKRLMCLNRSTKQP